jgi:hypothetical protein
MERDFKGVWIPKEIWYSEKLSVKEKIEWAEMQYGVKAGGPQK